MILNVLPVASSETNQYISLHLLLARKLIKHWCGFRI